MRRKQKDSFLHLSMSSLRMNNGNRMHVTGIKNKQITGKASTTKGGHTMGTITIKGMELGTSVYWKDENTLNYEIGVDDNLKDNDGDSYFILCEWHKDTGKCIILAFYEDDSIVYYSDYCPDNLKFISEEETGIGEISLTMEEVDRIMETCRKEMWHMEENPPIEPASIYYHAVKTMKPDEIDHHGNGRGFDDLYLKMTETSKRLVARLSTKSLLSTFLCELDGEMWYELPFCYPGEKDFLCVCNRCSNVIKNQLDIGFDEEECIPVCPVCGDALDLPEGY